MRYSNLVTISPLSSLYFGNVQRLTEKDQYPNAFGYVQKVSATDTLHIQLHADSDLSNDIYIEVMNNEFMNSISHTFPQQVTWAELSTGHWYGDYYIPCTALTGVLYVNIQSNTVGLLASSWCFEVGVWNDTQLVEVAHKNNDLLNTIFPDISATSRFAMRIEGGFVPDGFMDDSQWESMEDQSKVRMYVDAQPAMKETLMFGDANGLPRWVCEWLFLAFCCSSIEISALTIVRAGAWQPTNTGQRMQRLSMEVNVYDTLDGEIALLTEGGTLLQNELEQTLIV